MIDKKRLQNTNLQNPPRGQIITANVLLRGDYTFPRKTNITIENLERIPKDRGVIFALNHTDSYNYWPFMYKLFRIGGYPFISPWVKGKYYEHPLLAWFFDFANNIPLPSRGYVLTKDFQLVMKRRPNKTEYRLLRDLLDGKISQEELLSRADEELRRFIITPHGDFDPQQQPYGQFIENYFNELMQLVTQISEEALLKKNLSLLIFPQGTRSVRLLPGFVGIAQIALKTKVPIVPVGCNGSDKCYRSALPFSSGGNIVYRVGKPLTVEDDLAPFAITEDYHPFTRAAEKKFTAQFRGATDLVMERINELLDPEYQFAPDATAITDDTRRFV